MPSSLTITGYSTALFATWYFIEEYGVLFDCGDGACAALLQKARKVKHCFISHADRDHLTGLLQFLQLNGRPGLTIYYPKDSGSFPALAEFAAKFDPHVASADWQGIAHGSEIAIRDDLVVRAFENRHVRTDGRQIKSLSYSAESIRRKLKPEYIGMSGSEIAAIRKEHGNDQITQEERTVELIYSGDTPVELDGRYREAKILIHEATFLTRDDLNPADLNRNQHSSLDAVMEMVSESSIGTLILGHFSSRYSEEQIDEAIDREINRCGIKFPVKRVYPGNVAEFAV
jgi:ribonuclease Z